MTRIWYSLVGIGMGHAIRSETVISGLEKKHEIIITASNRSYGFLKTRHPRVHEIQENVMAMEDNSIRIKGTIMSYASNLFHNGRENARLFERIIPEFRPDILISDFENYSMFYAKKHKIPGIFLDNIHVLSRCKIALPKKNVILGLTKGLSKMFYPEADYYLICDFTGALPKDPAKTRMIRPIIRDAVTRLKITEGDFGLVYQTTDTNAAMLPVLKSQNRKYKIYGMGRARADKNLQFMDFDERGFLAELAACKYIIVNGGFTVMSEALYLKKPILSIPITNNVEQEYNAVSLVRNGYGHYSKELSSGDLAAFERRLPTYQKNLKKIPSWDNKETFAILERIIRQAKGGKRIGPG